MRKTYLILTILYTCNTAYSMENSLAVSPSSSPYRSAILIGGALAVTAGIGAMFLKRHLRDIPRQTSVSFQSLLPDPNSWTAIFFRRVLKLGQDAFSTGLRLYDAQEETSVTQGALHDAIVRNNETETRTAAQRLFPDQFLCQGRSHLQLAYEEGHSELAKILLRSGADANPLINDRSELNGSRLMSIIATTHLCHLPMLLEHSQQNALNRADNKGKTFLHTVSDIEDTRSQEAVIRYIKARNNLSFNVQLKEDTYKMTPLVYAAYRNRIGIFKLLCEKSNLKIEGEDVLGILDSNKRNCLWWAVFHNNRELVQEIVKHSEAEKLITQEDLQGVSPLKKAIDMLDENAEHAILNLLEQCLMVESAKYESNRDNKVVGYEKTLLHVAVRAGSLNLVKYLKGIIDPNVQDNEGKTALHYAVIANDTRIASELLDWETTDPNIQDCKGQTAVHYAGNEMKIVFSFSEKVDYSIQDNNGRKPNDSIFSRIRDWALGIK